MQKALFETNTSGPAAYGFSTLKAEATRILKEKFGSDVDTSGSKAIKVKANGNRRTSDVLVCMQFRRYSKYTGNDDDFVRGVAFLTPSGVRIENYPKLHSASLTAKHQVTNQWLKPTIRIFKNIRNRLVDDGKLQRGAAPSYYLEGLLWNAPNDTFIKDYSTTIYNCLSWMEKIKEDELLCANCMSALLGDNSPVKWNSTSFRTFRSEAITLWNNWT
jgi:hypothetical protein